MSQAPAATLPRARPAGATVLVSVDADAAVDAGRVVEALHERVQRQFAAYEAAEGSHALQYRAVRAIAQVLATHVTVEDELLYPAVRARTGRLDGEAERQLQQDHLLDLLLVELGTMIPADRGYDAKVHVLMQVFGQHARDAEELVVPELRRLDVAERQALGRRLLERAGQLESRPRKGW